jgi:hypothetical protein
MYTNVFEVKANSDNKSPLPNPLRKDYLLPLAFPLPLPNNFSLPPPLPFGSEKATPANAYFKPHCPFQ